MQLLILNEEFLVNSSHQLVLITSLPFVHTARRSYRLNDPVRPPDCGNAAGSPAVMPREAVQTLSFRGRRSRNKVSVGEPAEGSLPVSSTPTSAYRCIRDHFGERSCWRRSPIPAGSPTHGAHPRYLRSGVPGCAVSAVSLGVRSRCCRATEVFGPLARASPSELTQLLPMDILALATMKNAAKCDT